jgi:hypothetical protein
MELAELEKLKCKCILVNQFMAEHGGFPPAVRPFFSESNRRIDEAYSLCNARLLRAISSDIDWQIINHMPISMALKMKRIFKVKFGADLEIIEVLERETVKKILLAGEIANGEEYLLVRGYLNEIGDRIGSAKQIEMLNVLLSVFQGI